VASVKWLLASVVGVGMAASPSPPRLIHHRLPWQLAPWQLALNPILLCPNAEQTSCGFKGLACAQRRELGDLNDTLSPLLSPPLSTGHQVSAQLFCQILSPSLCQALPPFFFLVVLEIEPGALRLLGRRSTIEPHLQPPLGVRSIHLLGLKGPLGELLALRRVFFESPEGIE
jgi:hypothetical protein